MLETEEIFDSGAGVNRWRKVAIAFILLTAMLMSALSYLMLSEQTSFFAADYSPVASDEPEVLAQVSDKLALINQLSVSVDSEVSNKNRTLLEVVKSEQNLTITDSVELVFYNHSELYLEISQLEVAINKQKNHTYQSVMEIDWQRKSHIVLPPLGKVKVPVWYSISAKCLLKSYLLSWHYQVSIRPETLDFITSDNPEIKAKLDKATGYKGQINQVLQQDLNLTEFLPNGQDVCQYEI